MSTRQFFSEPLPCPRATGDDGLLFHASNRGYAFDGPLDSTSMLFDFKFYGFLSSGSPTVSR